MSKEREVAIEMIADINAEIAMLSQEIDELLEDGEDLDFMEQVRFKANLVINAEIEKETLERLLERSGE